MFTHVVCRLKYTLGRSKSMQLVLGSIYKNCIVYSWPTTFSIEGQPLDRCQRFPILKHFRSKFPLFGFRICHTNYRQEILSKGHPSIEFCRRDAAQTHYTRHLHPLQQWRREVTNTETDENSQNWCWVVFVFVLQFVVAMIY